jgi:hypothetical protein
MIKYSYKDEIAIIVVREPKYDRYSEDDNFSAYVCKITKKDYFIKDKVNVIFELIIYGDMEDGPTIEQIVLKWQNQVNFDAIQLLKAKEVK